MLKSILVAAMFFIAFGSAVNADTPYKETRPVVGRMAIGGSVHIFQTLIADSRREGIRRRLIDHCDSSCTLFANLLKDGLVCADHGTVLVFHRPVVVENMELRGSSLLSDGNLRKATDEQVRWVFELYDPHVRMVIMRRSVNGGLPPHGKELKVPAEDLGIPRC